jgi:endonuclease G
MATVYVIHAEADTPFVKQHVLRSLPSDGYDCWLARHHFVDADPGRDAIARAIDRCQAVLIILSPAALESPAAIEEINIALAGRRTAIVVQIDAADDRNAAQLPERLWALPKVDFTAEGAGEAEGLLLGLLPPVGGERETAEPEEAERIEWDEGIFSAALTAATARHDHARAEALIAALIRHLAHRQSAYPEHHAFNDLKRLRQEREFGLMRRYAAAVVASGTRQDRVRRMYGQALIETGRYDRALEVLQSIIDEPGSSREEIFEARGLIGRIFKQLYVDEPGAPGADELLRRAIAAYETAYKEERGNFWHGVNAASCLLRAERDHIASVTQPGRAREIAQRIAEDIDLVSQKCPLPVWDCASRVEALLALGRYDEAEQALDVYINHPDMMAFEVSSTFRQFNQVLQLRDDPRGAPLLARLRRAMERYRAGKVVASTEPADHAPESGVEDVSRKPLVIRLGDPAWEPTGITDLVIQSRLGKIVTARGSDVSVRELLGDPLVMSVEESRPAGQTECDRSMPFIKAAAQYSHAAGTYKETGDRALIAVIDNGIDVLHEAFLGDDRKSRIVGIWDQTGAGGTPPEGFSYGTFHSEKDIAEYVQEGDVPRGLGRNEGGHGTHVASIAGGRAAGEFAGGVAPDAKLLIVVSGGSGPVGYSQTHIDALAFIDRFAAGLGLPVVVNVSQGMNAGAHDGKSALEVAFDAFSESGRKQGRVVVKSAGNERAKGGHAKVTVKSNALEELRWRRLPGADYTERIELWWSSADEIEFRLREPDPPKKRPDEPDPPVNWSDWVGTAAPERKGTFPHGGPFQLVFTKRHVDNGDSLLLIKLGNETGEAARGDWLLEIHGVKIREGGEVHCWIERTQGEPSSFLNHGDEEMTLSIPGTAQSVIAVGAVDACNPIKVGAFSSYGPTRDGQKKPLVCAPGVGVKAAKGGTDHDAFPDTGTSMAAPHVTGAITLVLSRAAKKGDIPSGNQIASALRQKTQNYDASWDRGQGYGVIDVSALLAAFD